ncbi:hypothetical protein L1987_19930 [Smallanthus sonchifolius]|uniref:Uncharacterized protein n=1 Tax=Smallanthus sonchifolius TaxID=185202 RepID=A0ACB9IS27_9ASTR|nr:hypothetical protein L1987_19930 [Smallanthus sonchifolius]
MAIGAKDGLHGFTLRHRIFGSAHHRHISPFCFYHSADEHKHQIKGLKGLTINAPRRITVKAMKKMDDLPSCVQFGGVAPKFGVLKLQFNLLLYRR